MCPLRSSTSSSYAPSQEEDSVLHQAEAAVAEEYAAPQRPYDLQVIEVIQTAGPLGTLDDIKQMLRDAKHAKEVKRILECVVYRHHLCFDVLNGHGFRVHVLQMLTSIAPRAQCMNEWFDCISRFRQLGFLLTRTFAAEGLTVIRQWLIGRFSNEGRTPVLVTEGLAHIRELISWCQEDRLVFDHVLYTRIVFILTSIVSFFDRQNLYRSSFPPEFSKRDGIVVEWTIGQERCTDFDECVLQCDALMEEVLEMLRADIPTRPTFSLMYRLMDYYFATDNVEKMIATMEDAESYGVSVAESSTAKLMQLACAQNYPTVPELFMRWRVIPPQCVLATPDMSRLMLYYSRAGGGNPCPACGEPYNHRNVCVYRWLQTPPHQRSCPLLRMARSRKGELEERRGIPQTLDWSEKAFRLWDLSKARMIEWGTVEWRAFLLCCHFSPRGAEARALLDAHFDHSRMDDFLRAAYIRLLRHHGPHQAWPTIQHWQQRNYKVSPIVLQEGLMAAAAVEAESDRLPALRGVWATILSKDSYVMPFTKRVLRARLDELQSQRGGVSAEEQRVFEDAITMQPRHVSLLDLKDSASDFVVGTSKHNIYISPAAMERMGSPRRQRAS